MFDKFQRLMRQAGKRRGVSRGRKPKALRAEPLETRQLLAADTISSLVSSVAQSGAPVSSTLGSSTNVVLGGAGTTTAPLSAANFTYLGTAKLPVNQTGYESGLAYRPSTDTFFTIGNSGRAPFELEEIKIPAAGGKATLVKDWGPIDPPTNPLDANGSLLSMKGLSWDAASNRLWVSWGSYYNADHSNDECLAYVTFGGGTLHLHGPWGVPDSVGSDNVRGGIALAPAELQAITGQQFISFAGTGSTDQDESWGPSLTSFASPAALRAGSQTPAEELTHWPMLNTKYPNPNGGGNWVDWYSAFPRQPGDSVTVIKGNTDVNPPTQLSYQLNALKVNSTFSEGDGVYAGAWIQEPGIDGLVYFGRESEGYSWYGNYDSHNDESLQGARYKNDFESLEHPGQPLVDTAQSHRGNHADAWNWTVDFVSAASVLDTAEKVKAGTATTADLEQQPTSIINFTSLGGTVPLPRALAGSISGVYFDQATSTLYALEQYGQVLEWRIGAPAAQTTTTTAVAATIAVTPALNSTPVIAATFASPEVQHTSGTPIPAAVDLVMSEVDHGI